MLPVYFDHPLEIQDPTRTFAAEKRLVPGREK